MYHNPWNTRKGTVAALIAGLAVFSLVSPGGALADAAKCKIQIAKSAAKFESDKLKALQKCEDLKRKGKLPATTVCLAETKTAALISKAQAKLSTDIGKPCAGTSLTTIGWDGSGTTGNPVLAKQCSAGKTVGGACQRETQCGGICEGGGKSDESCTFNSSCANRVCVKANCIGGGGLNGTDCSSLALATACADAGGVCNWGQGCDGGSSGALGNCNGGSKNQATCNADSDCPGGGTCDPGCNTGTLLDCQSGLCNGAMCGTSKDCGLCQPGSPNQHQSCAADTDCGKVCVGGSKPGAACKVAATDCPGGGTCPTLAGSCATGTCTAGFCTAGGLFASGEARPSTGLCLPADRCPGFESNKFQAVKSCDGGSKNGQFCAANSDCTGVCVSGTCASGVNHNLSCSADSDCQACKNGCDFAIATTADVANCLTCVGEGSVDQIDQSLYGKMKPATYSCVKGANDGLPCTPATAAADCPSGKCKANPNDKDLEKCKQGVGKAAATFFETKRQSLEKCEEKVIGGKITGSCPDATIAAKIATAATKLSDSITKSCPAGVLPDSIGNLFDCANLTVPGASASCAGASGRGPITTVADLTTCIQCLTEFKVDCADRMAVPATGAMFAQCNPLCGNGQIDGHCSTTTSTTCGSTLDCPSGESCIPIETCDDGNSVSGDSCPSNCVIQSCTPSGSTKSIQIDVTAPTGVNLAGLSVYVEYPDGTVEIPGHGNDATVQASLTVPFDAYSSINDLDYAVRIALIANSPATVPSTAAVVLLEQCAGAPAPTSDMFRCNVESAGDTNSNNVSGVSCSVTVE